MNTICPKCGYVRQSTDACPEWQCPSCQTAYNKAAGPQTDASYGRYAVKPVNSGSSQFWRRCAYGLAIIAALYVARPLWKPKPVIAPVASAAVAVNGQPAVVLYGTTWCGYCRRAREFFRAQGIQFVDYDVENSSQARQEYENLGGGGIPIITVGSQVVRGFDEESLRDKLQPWMKEDGGKAL